MGFADFRKSAVLEFAQLIIPYHFRSTALSGNPEGRRDGLSKDLRMLQPVGFPAKRVTVRMVENPVQHGGGKDRIAHHLCPGV